MAEVTQQMWRDALWIRLGGHPGESCCEVERTERLTQATGETWRIEMDEEVDASGELGAFVLVCVCGGRAFLHEGISTEVA